MTRWHWANPEHDTEAHTPKEATELARRQRKVKGEMKMDTEKLPDRPASERWTVTSAKVSPLRSMITTTVAQGGYQG